MKLFLVLVLLFALSACQSESNKAVESTTATQSAAQASENPEDCDEAAKKPIEIKEDTISLSNTTGCTLEE